MPVFAEAQNACLQHNRLTRWQAANENTVLYTVKADRLYTVKCKDRCRFPTTALPFSSTGIGQTRIAGHGGLS